MSYVSYECLLKSIEKSMEYTRQDMETYGLSEFNENQIIINLKEMKDDSCCNKCENVIGLAIKCIEKLNFEVNELKEYIKYIEQKSQEKG